MSHVPRLEPVVLITSVPPGSLGRKKKREVQSALVGGSGKKPRLGSNLGSSIPSAQVEVLLPPLGSWKNRLFESSNQDSVLSSRRTLALEPTSSEDHVRPFYTISDDEVFENVDPLPGETPPDPDNSSTDDIPVRLLDSFAIYDWDSLRLVPISDMLQMDSGCCYGASGLVRPWVDDDMDPDDDDDSDDARSYMPQMTKLSPILELNVHHFSPSTGILDAKIYLKTEYAWYIVDTPSKLYHLYFIGYWMKHRALHLLVTSAMANSSITLAKFFRSPQVKADATIISRMLGRPLVRDDMVSENTKSYIRTALLSLSQDGIKLAHVPLVQELFNTDIYLDVIALAPVARQLLGKHTQQTVVTPCVYDLSMTMFQQEFRMVKPLKQEVLKSYSHPLNFPEIHGASLTMKWVGVPSAYSAIRIGKTVYQPGDVAIVLPGEDPDKTRQRNAQAISSQCVNPLAENWFIRICYLFERKGQQFLHGQWLAHGSKTLLQEAAHSNGLFLMNLCDDIPLASIIQRCNVHWLASDEKEPPEDGFNRFFCSGLIWDEDLGAFMEATQSPSQISSQTCAICDSHAAQKESKCPTLDFGSFSYLGATFHEFDFIYALHEQDTPYIIGQILSFTNGHANQAPQVQIRQLEHYDDVIGYELSANVGKKRDEQRLYFTLKTESIAIENIVGKCYVQHPSAIQDLGLWLCHEDHFYVQDCSVKPPFIRVEDCDELRVMDLSSHSFCVECYKKHMESISEQKVFVQNHRPLQALELFSGAGGLSIGLEDSGFIETKWAVEYAPSAARTFQYNKRNANVYNQDCNLLLEHAIETGNGKKLAPLRSLDDGQPLPPLPKPGEVDLVCGGPPCQGFSHANRHPRPDDPRNSLVCNMLSFAEFYKPKFFLLENVFGLLNHKLQINKPGPQEGEMAANGVIKFILRALTSLGYQVRFNVLQAAVYGSPQNRRRVIIWGARRGIPLPEFPIPTHHFEKTQWGVHLDTGRRLEPVTRDPERRHGGAPLRAVTVDDAISDLPKFDWKDPHRIIKATQGDKAEVKRRAAVGIPAFEAVSRRGAYDIDEDSDPFPGYPDGISYASAPRTRYQARAREGIAEDADVELHYTARYSEMVIERTCNVAMKPSADWRSLPRQLHMKKQQSGGATSRDVRFSRINGGGHFRTAMTTVMPHSQGATVIHPSQKRVLTVRECARAQGFPDTWKFLAVSERPSTIVRDQLRQIGNAVPVPLSRALGKALGKALIKMWEAEDKVRESGSLEL